MFVKTELILIKYFMTISVSDNDTMNKLNIFNKFRYSNCCFVYFPNINIIL